MLASAAAIAAAWATGSSQLTSCPRLARYDMQASRCLVLSKLTIVLPVMPVVKEACQCFWNQPQVLLFALARDCPNRVGHGIMLFCAAKRHTSS
eukprot:16430081-Heterocapsa_arctica.AAC.1